MAHAEVKPRYGGNLKIADELLGPLAFGQLLTVSDASLQPLLPFPAIMEGSGLTLDLSTLNPDVLTEIEKNVIDMQHPDHACHWILDYPYLSHHHATAIEVRDGKIHVRADSPETLLAIAESPCLLGDPVPAALPFAKTQFGYEANPGCLAGRPFLDSITPAPVDPVNPYLSFKLNDADVIPIPEDRYQQISRDPDLTVIPGPRVFVFLRMESLRPDTAAAVASAIRVADLSRAGLNGHTETLLNAAPALAPKQGTRLRIVIPAEAPYRLIGQRIEFDLREAGFEISPATDTTTLGVLSLEVFPFPPGNDDLLRYLLLRKYYAPAGANGKAWYETWDEYEASGRILPLFVHETMLAVRKNVRNLRTDRQGIPDFANAWIESRP
jgi:hypothetical protein